MSLNESLTWINSSLNVTDGAVKCMEIEQLAGRAMIILVLFLILGFIMGLLTGRNLYEPKKKGKGLRGKGWLGNLMDLG